MNNEKEKHYVTQDEMQSLFELQSKRIDRCEQLIGDHIKACAENRKALDEIKEMVLTVKTGMRFTNAVRNFILWIAGASIAISKLVDIIRHGF